MEEVYFCKTREEAKQCLIWLYSRGFSWWNEQYPKVEYPYESGVCYFADHSDMSITYSDYLWATTETENIIPFSLENFIKVLLIKKGIYNETRKNIHM